MQWGRQMGHYYPRQEQYQWNFLKERAAWLIVWSTFYTVATSSEIGASLLGVGERRKLAAKLRQAAKSLRQAA